MANTNEALVYGWNPQQLGATTGQTGYSQPGSGLATPNVSTAEQASSGTPSPAPGNVSEVLTNPGYASAGAPTLALRATTGPSGYTLVNGTGTIISWSVPNDGNLHRVWMPIFAVVTSPETGGQIMLSFTSPDGVARQPQVVAAGLGNGFYGSGSPQYSSLPVKAGTVVSVSQNSALTAGAATLWVELWGA